MNGDSRSQVARALRETAFYLRLAGENKFKARAYERAAHAIEHASQDIAELIAARQLTAVPGIGNRLASTIEEIHRTGKSRLLERLREQFPPGALELSGIAHLGLKKIAALHAALGIQTREQLKAACAAGQVRQVRGFGARSEQKLLAALTAPPADRQGHLLVTALAIAEPLVAYLRDCDALRRVELVGELRRRCETVDRLELLAATSEPQAVLDHFVAYPGSVATAARAADSASLRLLNGPLAQLHVVRDATFVQARHFLTGSAAHLQKLQQRAQARGLALQPSGLHKRSGAALHVRTESQIYRRLGMQPVAPELREDSGEIEAAAAGTLPRHLVRLADVQGMTHVHTLYSDGRDTIEAMAHAAAALGMRYLTITDHSPSAAYAGGVSNDRLRLQWDEIAAVQERVSIRLLRGTESDILRDGALDYPDALLEQFDVIIASIHSRHHLAPREMTRRIERAMRYPVFKIWGHPLGRLLNKRPPIECDVEQILDAIADSPAAIEINGDPHRLDLEPRWIRAARQRGIKFVLSTDAHSVGGLSNLRFAVAMARRGWVARDEVLNALPPEQFCASVAPARR